MKKFIFFLLFSASVCIVLIQAETTINLFSDSLEVEAGGTLELSCRVSDGIKGFPQFKWNTSIGEILETDVAGEVDYVAPDKSGNASISVEIAINGKNETRSKRFSTSIRYC